MCLGREHERLQKNTGIEHGVFVQIAMYKNEYCRRCAEKSEVLAHLRVASGHVVAVDAEQFVKSETGRAAARNQVRRVFKVHLEIAVRKSLARDQRGQFHQPSTG